MFKRYGKVVLSEYLMTSDEPSISFHSAPVPVLELCLVDVINLGVFCCEGDWHGQGVAAVQPVVDGHHRGHLSNRQAKGRCILG